MSTEEIPDCEFMRRLANGDDLALNSLMDRWSSRVTSFLHRMTGQREAAIDLAQETFIKLYQARGRYKPAGHFSTYLFSISANLARNHARWKSRHPAISLDATRDGGGIEIHELVDAARTPDEAAQAVENALAVHEAFLKLPPDLRECMTLFVYEGMGYMEIATICQCSPKAVETRIYRARQILKERLKEQLQEVRS
jgi:RNA polymerase sigma-70 factor (ECF subfamily)